MTSGVETRTELLDCALRLFVAHGYDGTGVQQIVAAAKVTKPTLYHHFGSKLGVLESLLRERLAVLHAAIERASGDCRDLERTLREVAKASFAFTEANPDLYRLYLSLWFAPVAGEAYRAALPFHERHFAAVEGVFRAAAAARAAMAGREHAFAATFLGMVNNYASLAITGYIRLDDAVAERAVRQFLFGICHEDAER